MEVPVPEPTNQEAKAPGQTERRNQIEDDRRINGLLDLARQHMQRLRELEEIEWKINFSVWGLLGGLAYLWVTGHVTAPEVLKRTTAFLMLPLPVILLHGVALFKLNAQQQQQGRLRDECRTLIAKLLGNTPPANVTFIGGIRWRDWEWIIWDLTVTAGIAIAVVFLIQRSGPLSLK